MGCRVRAHASLGATRGAVPRRRLLARAALAAEAAAPASDSTAVKARVALVTQPDSASPFALPEAYGGACAPWSEVLPHVAQRLVWAEPTFRAAVVTGDDDAASLAGADAAVFVGVTDPALAARLAARAACVPCVLAFDCAPVLQRSARLHFMPASSLLRALATALPWSRANRDAKLLEVSGELYDRRTPSDLLFLILLVADAAVAPVATLAANKRSGSLGTAWCMARHCASEVAACVSDVACKRTLDCLTSAGLNDQIAAYRCIVSYETPTFEAFSLCVLQKHNCLGNSAERPLQPELAPMASFRGRPLSHETAERLFIGWLDAADSLAPQGERLPFSWLVVAGANPAYDFFPSQHQLYYRKGRELWYDPVFRVQTLDGDFVWRRRHYRVRRDAADGRPGRFLFSVLDNGVTSLEHWAITAAADDLSWALFAYSGAARAAGQSYGGAVFVTPTGAWPQNPAVLQRVREAHDAVGLKLWELYTVDNSQRDGAPLALALPMSG